MKFISITSTLNPHIQEAIRMRQRRSAERGRSILIEGPHLVEMAFDAKIPVQKVFFTQQFLLKKDDQRLLKRIAGETPDVFEVTEHLLKKITDTETPQGIAAAVSPKLLGMKDLVPNSLPLYVVADGIQDPGNLGTIIRTADAAGADAVILLPGTCEAYASKTVRSTAGSIFTIPIIHTETESLLKWLKEKGIALMITAQDGDIQLFEAALAVPLALVLGNEAHGVSIDLRRAVSHSLRIPIYGRAESLNVAVSAAVCLYEAARQRNLPR